MGCDIHLHIEVKINNEWRHWATPSIDRDYKLFAKMAGVRNCYEVEPIAEPKGMPTDCSFTTGFEHDRWGVDGHSHSWFGIEEIKQLAEYAEQELSQIHGGRSLIFEYDILKGSYLCGNSFAGLLKYPDDYPKEIQDVRFVFWFDN